jgi:hypothetical protein
LHHAISLGNGVSPLNLVVAFLLRDANKSGTYGNQNLRCHGMVFEARIPIVECHK